MLVWKLAKDRIEIPLINIRRISMRSLASFQMT